MIIEIPIFDGGLITNVDPEDIPQTACSDTENFDLDVKGKLIKRKGLENKGTLSGSHLTKLYYWSDPNLTNGGLWVGYESQNSQIVSFAVNSDGSFGTKTALATLSSSPSDIQIIPMANSLRFANGKGEDVGFLQYIDRKFFFHKTSPAQGWSYDALKFEDAFPTYPTTWELAHVETVTGKMANGTYYYKAVPVFDGIQEAPFEDQYIKTDVGANDKGTHLTLKIDTDDFSPRITGLNIYRHYSDTDTVQPVYRLIKKINLATTDTSEDIESGHSNAHIGTVIYVPGGGLNSAISTAENYGQTNGDQEKVVVRVGGVDYEVIDSMGTADATYTDTLVTLNSGITLSTSNKGWDSGVTVRVYYRDDNSGQTVSHDWVLSNNGYWGVNTIYDARTSGNWDFAIGEKNDWVIQVGSQRLAVLESIKRIIKVNDDSTTTGLNQTVGTLSNGYYYEYLSNGEVKVHIVDVNGVDDRTHRLTTTKNKVNYLTGAFSNGRFFAGNVRLDPDDEKEDHSDFLVFSPINQPDILPVSNYLQIKDSQGGDIVGLKSAGDSLIVFMERGVHQLHIPSANPQSFIKRETDVNIGCVSANSIVEAGQVIFFAGQDNIYMTGSGRSSLPVSTSIKDVYQGTSNLSSTIGVFDPLKNRVLFRFGSNGSTIYALDYLKILSGQESWNKLTFISGKSVDTMSVDANLNIYTTHKEST